MKRFSEEKNKIINKWGEPRSWNEKYKTYSYVEYIYMRGINCKSIWVYNDLIFNRKKDMVAYIEKENKKEVI